MAQHLTLDSPWQVPITFVDRVFGESKLGPGEIVGCVGDTSAPVVVLAALTPPSMHAFAGSCKACTRCSPICRW